MKIPFSLAWRDERAPVTALLVPGAAAADVIDVVRTLALESPPKVFATAEGFLVVLPAPTDALLGGVVRLRTLAGSLFVPADADLIPPLLPDEARGLTRTRGLLFLPGNRVLAFDVERPLAWRSLVRVPRVDAPPWRPLPEAPAPADELKEATSIAPRLSVEAIIDQGRDDIGTESARPPNAPNIGSQILGTTLFVVGHLTAWLGTKLGLAGLAARGAAALQKALDRAPRLSEFLMQQQEALLRNLLRDFREGRIEEALRRALPLKGDNAGGAMSTSAQLPTHSLTHSLQNLLGGGSLSGSVWFTPDDLFQSLQAEYRKQAQAAARAGDFRRAAFIYGKLLNDLSAAAAILSQGGLHADAASIYEDALGDLRTAAREWEVAGEIEKAIAILVDRLQAFGAAGDLLRRVGQEERAIRCYTRAADHLRAAGKHFDAGELYRTRAGRIDLALPCYLEGWEKRPAVPAPACGMFLAEHYASNGDPLRFRQIVDDAHASAGEWTDAQAIQVFNRLAHVARRPSVASFADETRDLCLMGLALKLSETRDRSDKNCNTFFPADSPWPTPVVRDAIFAAKAAQPRSPRRAGAALCRLGHSTVRAVAQLPYSGDLFVGFENGAIERFSGTMATRTVVRHAGVICGIVPEVEENRLVVLARRREPSGGDVWQVLTSSHVGGLEMREIARFVGAQTVRLMATVENGTSPFFGVLADAEIHLFDRDNPSWRDVFENPRAEFPLAGIVGRFSGADTRPWFALFYESEILLTFGHPSGARYERVSVRCESPPRTPGRSTLLQPPVAGWLVHPNIANVHWVTATGEVFALEVKYRQEAIDFLPRRLAAKKTAPGVCGCVDRTSVGVAAPSLWDRIDGKTLGPNPVAAFRYGPEDILVVDANGELHLGSQG